MMFIMILISLGTLSRDIILIFLGKKDVYQNILFHPSATSMQLENLFSFPTLIQLFYLSGVFPQLFSQFFKG